MNLEIKEKYKGHIALLVANASWGLMAPVLKYFLDSGVMSSWGLAGFRIMGGALLFWLISALVPEKYLKHEKVEKRDFVPLFFASLLVIGANQALIILGMSHTSPIDAAVVCSLSPILTLILAAILLHQRITLLKAVGVALGFVGALLFVFGDAGEVLPNANNPMLGNALCLLAQVCGALYLVLFGKVISKYSSVTIMKWLFLISAVVIAPFSIGDIVAAQWSAITPALVADVAFVVLFGTCLAYLLIPVAQTCLAPTVIAMYNYLQPIVATFVSLLAGLAVLTGMNMLATVAVFAGVWLVTKTDKNK